MQAGIHMNTRLKSWLQRFRPSQPGNADPKAAGAAKPEPESDDAAAVDGFRETVEQIVIAFILAFVFRTFAAEPFVIPTGSMAPTLFGRHKEYTCIGCGYHNVIGASDELHDETGLLISDRRIESAICLNCGAVNDVRDELAFTGDRILVTKYPYEIGDPERFDVFVFKFPEEPVTNFIKRLVGMPGETILIWSGDVYCRKVGENAFEILRKDPNTQRHIQIPVYDDQYPPTPLLAKGWPERWAAVTPVRSDSSVVVWNEVADGFQHDAEERTFTLEEPAADWQWIRYRHYESRYEDWNALNRGSEVENDLTIQSRLIGDFCSYNAFVPYQIDAHHVERSIEDIDWGPYWVGDLTVSFEVDVQNVAEEAVIQLELVEGVHRYRCRIDLQTGQAELLAVNDQNDPDEELPLAEAKTDLVGVGDHSIAFANVDSRLCLWVDGDLVDFGDAASYKSDALTGNDLPTESDLTPVGIAVRGAAVEVSRLLLERDIYYRADDSQGGLAVMRNLVAAMDRPYEWSRIFDEHRMEEAHSPRGTIGRLEIEVGPHHYLALGDNSPRSRDSRVWQVEHRTVAQELLVGKAFWTYWPHGVPFMNDGRGFTIWNHYQRGPEGLVEVEDYPKFTFPFYPSFWRMRLIH